MFKDRDSTLNMVPKLLRGFSRWNPLLQLPLCSWLLKPGQLQRHHRPRNLLCSSQLAALTHCTRSAAFKICSAATICLKAPFLPWCKPKTAQPRFKLMNLLKEAGHPLPLIHADPGSIYSSDHLEKEKSHPKPSSLPVCSGWNGCIGQTCSDCSEMTCISRKRTKPQAGVNRSSHTPPLRRPHPHWPLTGRNQTEACQACRQ